MKTFYSYKNKMPEENLNLEGNVGATDPVADNIPPTEDLNVGLQDTTNPLDLEYQNIDTQNLNQNIDNQNMGYQNIDTSEIEYQNINNQDILSNPLESGYIDNLNINDTTGEVSNSTENIGTSTFDNLDFDTSTSGSTIDNSVFLDSGDESKISVNKAKDSEGIGKYLRLFFIASFIAVLGIIAIVLLVSFNKYISQASQNTVDAKYTEFVSTYKEKLGKIKKFAGLNYIENYSVPNIKDENAKTKINEIINATDIDYIEKKDLLKPFISELVREAEGGANQIETIKQDIAKQGFLPEEINNILSQEQALDTIQRSLNALEVIKFSTATQVFSYMDSAITKISDMIKIAGSSVESIGNLLNQLSERGENDISAYVYMCYLNPFETSANCDNIGDLDLYYNSIIKDNSMNIRLFKNAMNAINQILEKEESTLFSITFNGFNAQAEDITFKIEVYTNKNDETSLIKSGQRNPNIFIVTNIINLIKQSSFIVGGTIFTKEINVTPQTITISGIPTKVSYSTLDFTVPLQKSTEREIFDYIDLDTIQKKLDSLKDNSEHDDSTTDSEITESQTDNLDDTELNENDESEVSNLDNNEGETNDENNEINESNDEDNNENNN